MQNAAKTYFQTQFTTMGQGEVLLLLYDGALKFLAQAKEKIALKDYGAKGIAISKALDIISELDATLNPEAGGELVANLHQLYFICSTRLLKANLKMDVELIDTVIDVLNGLRSAYAEILHRPDAQAASRQIVERRKDFNIKGKADGPSAAPAAPAGAGGGARAQMAYSVAARQIAPEGQPMPVAAPAAAAPAATGLSQTQAFVMAQATAPAPAAPAPGPVSGPAHGTPPGAPPGAAPVTPPPPVTPVSPVNRSASVAAYGRAAQYNQS